MMRRFIITALIGACSTPAATTSSPMMDEECAADAGPLVATRALDAGDSSTPLQPDAGALEASVDAAMLTHDADLPIDDAAPDVITGASPFLKPRVLVYGNSIVGGVGISDYGPHGTSYPAILGDALGSDWEGQKWIARYGWLTASMIPAAKVDLLPYNTGTELTRTRRVLVFYETTNEIYTYPFCIDNTRQFVADRVREGWSVVVTTLIPTVATMVGGSSPSQLPFRTGYNDAVRAQWQSWGASGIADVGGDARLQNALDKTYFNDGIHLTDEGDAVMAEVTLPVVQALYVAP